MDKYLWAIRVFKTRTLATKACDEGKVKCKGANVKPSRIVAIGEIYDIRAPARKWIVEVVGLLDKRVSHELAIKCYTDLTPEEERSAPRSESASFFTGKRQSKIGRPTKKQMRDYNDFMEGDTTENQ